MALFQNFIFTSVVEVLGIFWALGTLSSLKRDLVSCTTKN